MIEAVRARYRLELHRCTERPGCPAKFHLSTCAELRDMFKRDE